MVANKPKMTRPTVYQFKLGDFTITNILEGFLHREDMHPVLAINGTAEEVEAIAKAYKLPFPQMEHQFIPTLVDTGEELIAFDPGFGDKNPAQGYYNGRLANAGYDVNDVDYVVVTHCHPDHIGNLTAGGNPTFPNAEIVFGETEFAFWKKGENIPDNRPPTLEMFNNVCLPFEDEARPVARVIREAIPESVPVVAAGGIGSAADAERALDAGVEVLSIGRAAIVEPDWPRQVSMPGWLPTAPPWTRERLAEVAVSDKLWTYLTLFPGLTVDSPEP